MNTVSRQPIPVLRPFVALVWASDHPTSETYRQPMQEHMLPTGMMHLAFRLNDAPLCIRDAQGTASVQAMGGSLVGGARSRFYLRDLSGPSCSVGAVLRPGAAALLFGAAADELAERHTALEDLWGTAARGLRERLLEAGHAENRLALLEAELAARLPRVRALHPAIASVIDLMPGLPSVEAAVRHSGISHRQFIALFRSSVGLAPKTYLRVLRFQRALQSLRQGEAISLSRIAVDAGYCDQAHFHRDFVELTGVTPTAYRRIAPGDANHLPVGGRGAARDVNFLQDAACGNGKNAPPPATKRGMP